MISQGLRWCLLRYGLYTHSHGRKPRVPAAEIAMMGAEGAVGILYRRELSEAPDKEGARQAKIKSLKKIRESVHRHWRCFVDEVIGPSQTRPKTIRALSLLENKRDTNRPKEHGNTPL